MIKRLVLVLGLAAAGTAVADGGVVTTAPLEVYKTVKSTLAKITLAGKVLQNCPAPIPSSRLQVELFFVPNESSLRERAAKEPVTRFDLDQGKFSRIVEIPQGEYRIKVINLRNNQVVGDQKLNVGSSDITVDLLVNCR